MDRADIVSVLSQAELFRGLDKPSLDLVAEIAHERSIPAGQHVFFAGDIATEFFVVASGRVRGFVPAHEEELAIAMVGPGRVFGVLAMLDGGPRIATALALEPTVLIEIARDRWLALVDEGVVPPRLIFEALGASARRIADYTLDFLFLDVEIPDSPPPSMADET